VGIKIPFFFFVFFALFVVNPFLVFLNLTALIEAYQGRRFTEALDLFQNVAKLHPEDVPTQIYLKRCNKAITEGVSDDWTGIEKILEK